MIYLIGAFFAVIGVLVLRAVGAWMFRIDVVIDELKKLNKAADEQTKRMGEDRP